MKQGMLIILSGPSGVGKGTIRKIVLNEKLLDVAFCISDTTRMRRIKEKKGKEYNFISKEEFEERIKQGYYLEYVEYCGNYYGTPKGFIEENLKKGVNVLLEIEAQGAKRVMEQYAGMYTLSIFLMPPSIEELERRIRLRHSEDDASLEKRLNKAREEMSMKDNYDVVLTNYTLKKTAKRFATSVENRMNYINAFEEGRELPRGYRIKRP